MSLADPPTIAAPALYLPAVTAAMEAAAKAARRLSVPALAVAIVSLAAGASAWASWLLPGSPGSLRTFLPRLAILALFLAPGAFLLLVHRGLRRVSRLPDELRAAAAGARRAIAEVRGIGTAPAGGRGALGRPWDLLRSLLALRSAIAGARETLGGAAGAAGLIAFAANPFTLLLAAACIAATALLALAAATGLVRCLIAC